MGSLFAGWGRYVADDASETKIVTAVLTLLILVVGALLGLRRWRRWIAPAHPASRLGRASQSLWAMVRRATFEPLFVLAGVQVLRGYGLLPAEFNGIADGLIAVALGAVGRGVATGLLSPREPERRLLAVDDHTARVLSGHLVVAARLISLFAFVDVLQKAVYSPPVAIGLASVLFAVTIVAVMTASPVRYACHRD